MGALKHIDKADSQQAASVVSILQERLTFFRYLTDRDGAFSFRKFVQDEAERRSLFLMNIPQYDAIFQSLMTFAIDIMSREVLSLPDSHTGRITFRIDEFGSLAKMPSIFDFLTMGRSKGGFLKVTRPVVDHDAHLRVMRWIRTCVGPTRRRAAHRSSFTLLSEKSRSTFWLQLHSSLSNPFGKRQFRDKVTQKSIAFGEEATLTDARDLGTESLKPATRSVSKTW